MRMILAVSLCTLVACSPPRGEPVDGSGPSALEPAGPPALAEATGDPPHLAVQILEVTRAGAGTVDVRFAVLNTSAVVPVEVAQAFAAEGNEVRTVADMYLLDPVGQRRYFVMRDADNRPLCSEEPGDLSPGERLVLWARFAAPPAVTQHVDIHLPGVPPLEDVPIEDAQEARENER